MDRLVYTALTGLHRSQESQAVTAHNLANASTPGFRREMAALSAGFLSTSGAALSARAQSGGESPHDLLVEGRIDHTGNALDIAMGGTAWLVVQDNAGAERLTKRGDLRVSPDGTLQTGDGRAVVGEDGPIRIAAGFHALRIAGNGAIETRIADDAPFVQIARLKLVSPPTETLTRQPDGLFSSPDLTRDEQATVKVGVLERSNVEPAAALVELVEQSRRFEIQTRMITTARDLDEASASLMRVQ